MTPFLERVEEALAETERKPCYYLEITKSTYAYGDVVVLLREDAETLFDARRAAIAWEDAEDRFFVLDDADNIPRTKWSEARRAAYDAKQVLLDVLEVMEEE